MPYGDAAEQYIDKGWRPIPVKGKSQPVSGYTGRAGVEASVPDIYAWCEGPEAQHNLALRLPRHVVGIDVDDYDQKKGLATVDLAQAALGPLPPTWTSTSRGPGQPSRIHLYRASAAVSFVGAEKKIRDRFGPDVDVLHHGHRYSVTWPSVHPDSGQVYRWHNPAGLVSTEIPAIDDLTLLPDHWQRFLMANDEARPSEITFTPVPEPKPDRFSRRVPVGQRSAESTAFTWSLAQKGIESFEMARLVAWAWFSHYVDQPAGDPFPFSEVETALRNAFAKVEAESRAPKPIEIPDEGQLRAAIELEKYNQRVRRTAKAELDAEEAKSRFRVPDYTRTLAEEFALPDEALIYTIDQLLPKGGNALLAAKFKAGKTTLLSNLLRSLVDGELFLGQFKTRPLTGRVGFLNYEVGRNQFRSWLKGMGLKNPDRASVLNLRGFRLPLTTPVGEDWVVRWLKEQDVEFLILDPFAAAYVGTGSENSNDEVSVWLSALDVIKERSGVEDLVLAAHFGRNEEERVRGASRLDDWPDARWTLTVNEDVRYFSAHGRDVAVPEFRLGMNEDRVLDARAGNRKAAGLVEAVMEYVRDNPGANQSAIRTEVTGSNTSVSAALDLAVMDGLLRMERRGTSKHYHLAVGGRSGTVPDCSGTEVSRSVPVPPLGTGTGTDAPDPEQDLTDRFRKSKACETCGEPGVAFGKPWFTIRCQAHNPMATP